MIKRELPAAIILGLEVNGLTVCRALGKHGVPLIAITNNAHAIGRNSKYISRCHIVDFCKDVLLSFLMGLKTSCNRKPILFPTTDEMVGFIADNANVLIEKFTLPFSNFKAVSDLLDKNVFKTFAYRSGLCVASSKVFIKGEIIDLSHFNNYPLIIKTCKKIYNKPSDIPKAVIAYDSESALLWINKYLQFAECIVEDYIGGDDSSVHFVFVLSDASGKIKYAVSGKKIRQWPPNTGGTASATLYPNSILVRQTVNFFEQFDIGGLASMEYKYDAINDKYVAIEPTIGRIDFQEGLAIGNGINFPYLLYCQMTGIECKTKKQVLTNSKLWICFDADYKAFFSNKPTVSQSLKWFFWLLRPMIYSVFDIRDMKPFFSWVKTRYFHV